MRLYINDASLQGQFHTIVEFEQILRGLVDLRKLKCVRSNIFVTRTFSYQRVTEHYTLAHAVQIMADRDLRVRVLQWVNGNGPFLDDDRLAEQDDFFECLGIDVTDQGLGEAARRKARGLLAGAWSFVGGATDFAQNPLEVAHGIVGARIGAYEIPNVWTPQALLTLLINALAEPTSWAELTDLLRLRFPRLLIGDAFYDNAQLQAEPYSAVIADRAQELCRHLDEYMASRNKDGSDTDHTAEMMRTLFSSAAGADPLFSGESSTNQASFKREMTFKDPASAREEIFAHWHGKIRHRVFRIHFEWPVPRTSRQLKVLYLGPKLTKG
jgi:hypothetical protein